jgi:hypothetical protein
MKNTIIGCLLFCSYHVHAQTLPNFELIKLEKISDYKKAEPFVLQTATFLLSTPFKSENKDRSNSLRFISQWMNGTPDYSLVIFDVIDKIGKDNIDLLGVYISAMTKFTLENKAAAKDVAVIKLNAMTMLIKYCENKDNNLKMSKQIKKLAEANEKGQLEQALK